MNIFNQTHHAITAIYGSLAEEGLVPAGGDLSKVVVELPRDLSHGDLSTNVAMVTSKQAGMKPRT